MNVEFFSRSTFLARTGRQHCHIASNLMLTTTGLKEARCRAYVMQVRTKFLLVRTWFEARRLNQ
jgi:hypothetical protein